MESDFENENKLRIKLRIRLQAYVMKKEAAVFITAACGESMEREFYGREHRQKIEYMESLWENLHALADLCREYGIEDMMQDNGLKVMQQLVYMNMDFLPGREGNDSISASGTEWEMKSVNNRLTSGFSTNHHTNHDIIRKYRQVPWSFAIYEDIWLLEIYVMTPAQLEPVYRHWEEQLVGRSHLNNPKIPVRFVRENGLLVYPIDPRHPVDPDSINW